MRYVIEVYCRNSDCCVRECEIAVKDYDPIPDSWRCPACGEKTAVHSKRTHMEDGQQKLETAIGLVNVSLYQREYPDSIGYPLAAFMLKTLPESWRFIPPEWGAV